MKGGRGLKKSENVVDVLCTCPLMLIRRVRRRQTHYLLKVLERENGEKARKSCIDKFLKYGKGEKVKVTDGGKLRSIVEQTLRIRENKQGKQVSWTGSLTYASFAFRETSMALSTCVVCCSQSIWGCEAWQKKLRAEIGAPLSFRNVWGRPQLIVIQGESGDRGRGFV